MTSILKNLLVSIFAFLLGISIVTLFSALYTEGNGSKERASLTHIAENIEIFDGKYVEIESFAQLDAILDGTWTLGEPFEKNEILTFLELVSEPKELKEHLAKDLSENEYNRVHVVVSGKIRDNCSLPGITTCCFGRTMTLQNAKLTTIGSTERYRRPAY